MTITESNVTKVIGVATVIYWVVTLLFFWSDYRSGNLLEKGGWWIAVILFTGTCGMAFWLMLGPPFVRSLRGGSLVRSPLKWGEMIWCFSTLPMVLFCFGLLCLLVFYRITEG